MDDLIVVIDASVLIQAVREGDSDDWSTVVVPPFRGRSYGRMCLEAAGQRRLGMRALVSRESFSAASAVVYSEFDGDTARRINAALRRAVDAAVGGAPLAVSAGSAGSMPRGGYEDSYDAVALFRPHLLLSSRDELPDIIQGALVIHPKRMVELLSTSRF